MFSALKTFYKDRKVFITGHTGFKGSWLCLWLKILGAEVTGYALDPPTIPSLFELCKIGRFVKSTIADIRDGEALQRAMRAANPDIAIHMAAQAIVRESYKNPAATYAINLMGTVHFLEAVRNCDTIKSVINVTTDKCYENREWVWGYRENEPLGGYDPYSNSKACSELVTSAYRNSFFNRREYHRHGVGLASARAGNVIGGGDWAQDRLIPDCIRSLLKGETIVIRNPQAVRPWQHVLEPLSGYLELARRLYEDGARYGEAWNFGPSDEDAKTVEWLAQKICAKWGENAAYEIDRGEHLHESQHLKLDHSKASSLLGWRPRWDIEKAVDRMMEWMEVYRSNGDLRQVCERQIEDYSDRWARE